MNTSFTFRFFKKIHIISNESQYGNISLIGIIKHTFKTIKKLILYKYAYSSFILEPLNFKKIRALCWKWMGCNIGKNVLIGHSVSIDYGNTDLITIEDEVIITNNCTLLCHKRDLKNYNKYDSPFNLPYVKQPIYLRKGCQIGMGSIIMPGVEIGEGAIIGAHSVVTKNIPAWTVAAGSPAKIIKEL